MVHVRAYEHLVGGKPVTVVPVVPKLIEFASRSQDSSDAYVLSTGNFLENIYPTTSKNSAHTITRDATDDMRRLMQYLTNLRGSAAI